MADSKAQSLAKRTINSLAAITGVRLWSGKTGDPNDEKAQGVDMSEMITSAKANASNDYQGLTGKGFHASLATTTEKGIVEKSTDNEIVSETTDKFISADLQGAMREHWGKAENNSAGGGNQLGRPKIIHQDGVGENVTESYSFKYTICFHTNRADSTTKIYYPIFNIPSGLRPRNILINGVYRSSEGNGYINNVYLDASTETKVLNFGGGNFKIVFPNSTSPPYIDSRISSSQSLSLDIHIIAR